MSNILELNLADLQKAIRDKNLSAKEITEAYLQAIEQNSQSNCFISITKEKAIQMAEESDKRIEKGEALGFATIVIGDHIVFPTKVDSTYPYTVGGAFPGQGDALEQLTLMSFIAARTETARLVTSVMILPHRNPLVTAKVLATIDVLSKGRVTVGVGVGWMREEFEALGAPDFDKRGASSNEYIEIFKKCWTEDLSLIHI